MRSTSRWRLRLTLGRISSASRHHQGVLVLTARRKRMVTLVTGGSGSGKSAFAEQEIVRLGKRRRIYIATMKPWDEECRRRI